MSAVDNTVGVVHLADFDRGLTKSNTPDWYIYESAAKGGFDGIVTRDYSQTQQQEELWVLTKLKLHVITFRKPVEDPIVEWGQLLAYLPLVRRRFADVKPRVIFLPRPDVSPGKSVFEPKELLHRLANELGISGAQIRSDARKSVDDFRASRP